MNNFYYSDSTVEQFFTDQETAFLTVRDVHYENALVTIRVKVNNFSLLQENKGEEKNEYEDIESLEVLGKSSEVLDLSMKEDRFTVLIQWNLFQPRKTLTRSYNVIGEDVVVDVSDPYPDER